MKIGVLTNAFDEQRLIANCVEQFKPWFRHIVWCNEKSWEGGLTQDDSTAKIAHEHGATAILDGNWVRAHDQFNLGLREFELEGGFDWIIICDADERWAPDAVGQLVTDLANQPDNVTAVRSNQWEVYWKTDYRIHPPQTDYPLVAVRPYEHFQNIRQPSGSIGWTTAKMHHFSYSRTNEDMWKKVQTFEAAREFQVKEWYDNVWMKWNPTMQNLHPVVPDQFKFAYYKPAPKGVIPVASD